MRLRGGREATNGGPRPFSSSWLRPVPQPATPREFPQLPSWIPSPPIAGATIVLLLLFFTTFAGGINNLAQPQPDDPAIAAISSADQTPQSSSSSELTPVATEAAISLAPTSTPDDMDVPAATRPPGLPGSILPAYRVLSYYGHPLSENMGILGEYGEDMDALLARLQEEQAAFEAADPSRPVKLALEVIASVAQDWPADNDTYLLHTGTDLIDQYVEFAHANDMLLILDMQIGHSTVEDEIEKVRPYLELPFVHLALDPEFAMAEGEIPGEQIGGLDAEDITYAQETLAALAEELDLPPKMLIVHRFEEGMITNAEDLEPVDGVQLVIDFDGFGTPEEKTNNYELFITDQPVEYGGIKLFYRQDNPLMTAEELMALSPPPDLVIFQ